MNIAGVINASIDNFYFYLHIPEIKVFNVKLSNDHVGMFARDYDLFLQMIVQT